eukprot:scaffold25495_cov30-Tisochrysis_lutea.AAC.11
MGERRQKHRGGDREGAEGTLAPNATMAGSTRFGVRRRGKGSGKMRVTKCSIKMARRAYEFRIRPA